MVVDSCPSCPHSGDLDLSNSAWDSISGNQGPSQGSAISGQKLRGRRR
jgi:hypothetical protein